MGNRPAHLKELDSRGDRHPRPARAASGSRRRGSAQEREIEFLDTNGIWYNIADPVDMWMSAGGPKGFALAAKHADAMTYCLGPNPDMIGVVRRELDKAVAEAGRPAGLGQARRPVLVLPAARTARPGRTESTRASAPARSAPASPTPAS